MIRSFAIAIAALLLIPVSTGQSPVPVSEESHHHLKFQNEYVRVFDVTVNPGDSTLFHTHSNDYVFVSIGDATLKVQLLGGPMGDLILKNGEVRFTKATITHRVVNESQTPFRNITVEIVSSPGVVPTETTDGKVFGQSLVLENDRVRVWQLVLEPGQSTGPHKHSRSELEVIISGDRATEETPGEKPRTRSVGAGEFLWRAIPRNHSVKNVGSKRFEALEIEWK
jgi:quercetin dioxygenase-like cupin family protein